MVTDHIAKVITAVQVVILAVLLLTRGCERTGEAIVPVRVPLSSVTMIDSTPQAHIDVTAVRAENRAMVARMQDTIDALRAKIAAMGGRTTFRTDSLLKPNDQTDGGQPDTIRIECDETNRRIALYYGFAPRMIDVVVPRKPWLQGVASGGLEYDLRSRLSPRGMVGALVNITDDLALQVGIETRLSSQDGRLQSILATDLRWTF